MALQQKKRPQAIDPVALMNRVEKRINDRLGLSRGTLSANPLELLLELKAGVWPAIFRLNVVAGSPEDLELRKPVPIKLMVEAAKLSARYIYPQLTAGQLNIDTGPVPITAQQQEIASMMGNAELRRKIEDVVFSMTSPVPKALEAPAILVTDATATPAEEEILSGDPETGDFEDGPALDSRADPDGSGEDHE